MKLKPNIVTGSQLSDLENNIKDYEIANSKSEFVICIKNDDYPESLKIMKTYKTIFDAKAIKHQLIRVIDETGEDYLYSLDYFIPANSPSDQIKAPAMKKQVVSVPTNASTFSSKQIKH
jgi:hypothetical protein